MAAPALSLRKKLLFSGLLSLGLLALFLGTLEVCLRLAGNGASPQLARLHALPDGTRVWRDNRDCTVPFFGAGLARRPLPFRLSEHKQPGTYRIFVLGSSAAMGDPEPSFSLARVLELMLSEAWPEAHFEVVNAGITAINSHLLPSIAKDCAKLEPDLFIVYEGNNEVIGPFGPSGVLTPFLSTGPFLRSAHWLLGTRTGQLITRGTRKFRGTDAHNSEWGGMSMFLGQSIAQDDPRLTLVAQSFVDNLRRVASEARSAGSTTLLCTVAVNQRDFAPFLSQNNPSLSEAELLRWKKLLNQGSDALAAGDKKNAEDAWQEALRIDAGHAELNYRLGRLLLSSNRDAEAREFLRRACDLDTLRFRTDSRLNQALRSLGKEEAPGLVLVDLATQLADLSPQGLSGDNFLYEHVHLNLRGTYEAARALFPHINEALQQRGLPKTKSSPPPLTYDRLRLLLAFTTHEQAMIQLSLLARYRAAPFTGQSDNPARLALAERRAQIAQDRLSRPEALATLKTIYTEALSHSPNDWVLARNAGAMLLARQLPAEALPQLERAQQWIDDDIDTLLPLGLAHQALGHTNEAEKYFALARQLEPKYPGLPTAPALPK